MDKSWMTMGKTPNGRLSHPYIEGVNAFINFARVDVYFWIHEILYLNSTSQLILFRFLLIGIILDDCVVKIKCYCYFLLSSRNLLFFNSPNSEIQFFSSLKILSILPIFGQIKLVIVIDFFSIFIWVSHFILPNVVKCCNCLINSPKDLAALWKNDWIQSAFSCKWWNGQNHP